MIVTVTSIRLRKWWYFFRLSWFGLHVSRQAKAQKGFLRMKNTGSGLLHFTLTAWENEAAMRAFAGSGAHLIAMKSARSLATELRTHTYETDAFPAWPEAKEAVLTRGRVFTYA